MSSIPSPNSAFTKWDEYEPNPPNIGVNTNNNYGIIRYIPISRKRKYAEITQNESALIIVG